MSKPSFSFPLRWDAPVILAVMAAVIVLANAVVIIQPGYRGVKKTIGRLSPHLLGEGPHLVLPLVQQVELMSTRQQTAYGKASLYSRDLQTMHIEYAVLYRLPENKLLTLAKDYPKAIYEDVVVPRIEDNIKSVATNYTAQEYVNRRDAIKTKVIEQLRDDLKGLVMIEDLPIRNVDLSPELEKAIENKQIQQQKAQAEQYKLEQTKIKAEGNVVAAKGEAEAIRLRATALEKTPRVVDLEKLRVEELRIQKWNGQPPKTVILGDTKASVLLPAD
jgi:prohibitin 2